jgi:hypothetical protein
MEDFRIKVADCKISIRNALKKGYLSLVEKALDSNLIFNSELCKLLTYSIEKRHNSIINRLVNNSFQTQNWLHQMHLRRIVKLMIERALW